MTLRLRLVLALLALTTAGLTVFGVVTYTLYARAQYERLDQQLEASIPPVSGELLANAGLGPSLRYGGTVGPGGEPGSGGGGEAGRPAPPSFIDSYAELRDANGAVVGTPVQGSSSSQPALPATLPRGPFTANSISGSTRWRALSQPTDRLQGGHVVVAVPLTETEAALQQLIFIEATAASLLLALLAAGSWYILRRGLQPLESMATQAHSITAGDLDLSQRVSPSEDKTEVGQLGMALNTMLGEIEDAFREREATEQRLRQFLADASHELRTPLTSIQGFAELARLGADQDRLDGEVIQRRIEEESARMKVLVEDLLLLARLDETRPSDRAPVDLAVLAADACSDAVALASDRKITLDAPEPVVVLGDQDHLRQAIANLVANAVKHTPDGSPIEVGAHIDHGEAVVTVTDHGDGLDDVALAQVFDRFWRADEARVGTGAGLGLAIVAGIAAEHGGSASAVNHDGGGAVFTIRLPL
ncbi:MAG: HAMP domain-containing histidine kinase [Actinobacteria bacterium]|nr:HAMP domain-containing histidine kinase [Actinomycetota bacterium]